jgi:hypothetical protein
MTVSRPTSLATAVNFRHTKNPTTSATRCKKLCAINCKEPHASTPPVWTYNSSSFTRSTARKSPAFSSWPPLGSLFRRQCAAVSPGAPSLAGAAAGSGLRHSLVSH